MAAKESVENGPGRSDFALPPDFLFGVSNAAYQVEGGYNLPGGPYNNWAEWEREGKVEKPGETCRFWDRYREHIDLAASLGLNAFRLSLEWARLQPAAAGKASPPAWDEAACDRYAEMVGAVLDAGMEPVVTLHHFTHPAWCGADFWLDEGSPQAFAGFCAHAARDVNERLVKAGRRPIRIWVTINEPNLLGLLTYVSGEHPHGKMGISSAKRAFENLTIAHVLAYNALHDLYEEMGWDTPRVSFNNYCMCFYPLDKAGFDLVRAPSLGISRSGLEEYIRAKKEDWDRRFSSLADERWGHGSFPARYYRFINWVYGKLTNPLGSRRAIEAIYASPRTALVDYLGLDIYDPFTPAAAPKFPTPRRLREKEPLLHTPLWENRYDPREFGGVIRGYAEGAGSLPIYVLESGMCHRQPRDAAAIPRSDGLTRDVFLERMLGEVVSCIREGISVEAYSFWSLTDNYEWGSFEPRFGLHEYDFSRGEIKESDGQGIPAGKVYGDLIAALKSGGT
ncbi:MAG: glycoside hydrolase family 1 protein [Actinobacteria bacterium]|jgi:beta-glucosidase/6-phospho-beta-glucosidase/beta-galactosidase|nr:MAG: glycoside hydrolase family 1 protein [Actinomycetota bacterium]